MVAAVLTTNSSMMTVLAGGIIVSLLLKCDNPSVSLTHSFDNNKNHKQKKMLQYKMLAYKVLTPRVWPLGQPRPSLGARGGEGAAPWP